MLQQAPPQRAVALLCLLLGLAAPVAAQDGLRIAYVDMQRLVDESPQTLESRARLQREFEARDALLSEDEARLAALEQRQRSDAAIMSAADAEALDREIETLRRSVRQTRERLRTELNERAESEYRRFFQQISDSVIEFARDEGIDLIVPGPVVFASNRIDVTERVLERLRREHQREAQP
ncbi:MAG TPA: OmpH family outer membrane protein [Xanthomonadaceae bacterium]|nr:OmpH family outer membrane protein [Xanthomonadaceae bacterium]